MKWAEIGLKAVIAMAVFVIALSYVQQVSADCAVKGGVLVTGTPTHILKCVAKP